METPGSVQPSLMLRLTPSRGLQGWNANNHRLRTIPSDLFALVRDGFPLARLRSSQRSAAPPLQARRPVSSTLRVWSG